jgi:hypothetical protein
MPILVYTPTFSSRIKYAFTVLLGEVCGADELTFTTDLDKLNNFSGTRINYSREAVDGSLQFAPAGLLTERDITEQDIYISKHRNVPVFFNVSNSALPFDPFAAGFYLISRYEEYLPHIGDEHNRFPAKESLAYKQGFLDVPVVNIWAGWVKELIRAQFPDQHFSTKGYEFISTVDVDNLFAHKGKGVFRSTAGIIKDIITFHFAELNQRLQTLLRFKPDQFDTFERQIKMRDAAHAKSIYFILFAEFAQYDRNISMHSPLMHEQVRGMNDYTEVGIHPSYESNKSAKRVEFELRTLEEALRKPVTKSRQHFLKMRLPDTIRQLADLGVTDEYSMGYASDSGFRAGMASPYTFYDLEMEVALPVTIHPFMVMDVTYIDYKKYSTADALEDMKKMVDATRSVNGQFISVFHHRVFSEKEFAWHGWNTVYHDLLAYAKE